MFGVHPVLAAVGAIVLVLFGAVLGAWFDLQSRPDPPVRVAQAVAAASPTAPSPSYQPPQFLDLRSEPFALPDRVGPPTADGLPAAMDTRPAPMPALTAFAVPSRADARRPAVAVVIDDMGLDRARSVRMLDLPGPLTLSFLTYATDLQGWADRARDAGHEVMAHVPMEPLDRGENPGPRALTMAMSADEIGSALDGMLDGWQGYVGVNNHMGSRLTADPARMGAVMAVLRARGLMWLDSRTSPQTRAMDAAATAGVPAIARDVFLDNAANAAAINNELAALERQARATGMAVAIGHPYDATYEALAAWLPTLAERGLVLVPASEIVRRKSTATQVTAGNQGGG
ncbi:MAG: divergent polysaccharide deacetylase family protein [Rhodospirillaceae bacterium]|nr:divergent polysaccharide deacetylase family protein [Rhodospirillaceae bacterium]